MQVFNNLAKKRTVHSWTIMLGVYAQHGHVNVAIEILINQMPQGSQPANEPAQKCCE